MYSADVKYLASSFSVPAKIADEMLTRCTGEQLKVILCILRNPGIDDNGIAEKTGLSADAAAECADFWADAGLIVSEKTTLDLTASEKDSKETAEEVSVPKIVPLLKPTQQEIDKALEKSRSLRNLFNEAQQILGKTYGYTMQSLLYNIVYYYGLSQDVANLLLNFAKYADTCSQQELLKIAKYWSENGITDCSAANDFIHRATKGRKLFSELAELTGNADSSPTFAQYELLCKWILWGFDAECVAKAHSIMKSEKETGTLNYRNFQYMDKVLKGWHEAGVHTVKEIEAAPSSAFEQKKKQKQKKETSFDIELVKEKSRDRTRDIGNMKNKKRTRRA